MEGVAEVERIKVDLAVEDEEFVPQTSQQDPCITVLVKVEKYDLCDKNLLFVKLR